MCHEQDVFLVMNKMLSKLEIKRGGGGRGMKRESYGEQRRSHSALRPLYTETASISPVVMETRAGCRNVSASNLNPKSTFAKREREKEKATDAV